MSTARLPELESDRELRRFNIALAEARREQEAQKKRKTYTVGEKRDFVQLHERAEGGDLSARATLVVRYPEHNPRYTLAWLRFEQRLSSEKISSKQLKLTRYVKEPYTHHAKSEPHTIKLVRLDFSHVKISLR